MKVICIDASENEFLGPTGLVEGETYTVVKVIPPIVKHEGYLLDEIKSNHYTGAFLSKRFALVSEIDEMELLKERESEPCLN